jgi:hypothetical protein
MGIEFKYRDASKMTKSMQVVLKELPIKKLQVIYPGGKSYALSEKRFSDRVGGIFICGDQGLKGIVR